MSKQTFDFNIEVELYENEFGDLAMKMPGEKVFGEVGTREGELMTNDFLRSLSDGSCPNWWQEIPAHQLLYARGWHCVSRHGFINGDVQRPAVEFETEPERLGTRARAYLRHLLH